MYVCMHLRERYMVFPGEVTVRSRLLMRAGPVFPLTPGGSNQASVTLNVHKYHTYFLCRLRKSGLLNGQGHCIWTQLD